MCDSIKISKTEIRLEASDAIEVSTRSNTPILQKEASKVTVSPRSYHIVSQDVYTIKRNNDPEPWFKDMLENAIDNSNLADEVSDLENQFVNFEDGVTKEIGYLRDADSALAYDLNVLKVSNDSSNAAIQHLNLTKVTADEASAISQSTLAAWQDDGSGGAWFDSQVSVVSNVAYSAAKSASTLTASINSQQDQLNIIAGDIDTLEKQVDGKVETWFSEENPNLSGGELDPAVEPYKTWLANNEMAIHTGDTYVWFEYDAVNPTQKNLLATFRFALDTATGTYEWYLFEDDLASAAYQQALQAQATADGKIVTFYQTFEPPHLDSNEGDLWLDSDDDNKMYRYNGSAWTPVEDKRIYASVNRLDEATVDVNGEARAKSSLSVDANGSVAGFVAASDGSTSTFRIYADKFSIANSAGSDRGNPFEINTTTGQIGFTGNVTFNGTPVDTAVQPSEVNRNVTSINGGVIQTGTLNANRIEADSVWVDGTVKSNDYKHPTYTGDIPTGFALASDKGNLGGWNIVGGRMYGGYIYGATLDAAVINTGTLNADVINSGSITSTTQTSFSATGSNTTLVDKSISINNSGGSGTLVVCNISLSPIGDGSGAEGGSGVVTLSGSGITTVTRKYNSYDADVFFDIPTIGTATNGSARLVITHTFGGGMSVSGKLMSTQFKK